MELPLTDLSYNLSVNKLENHNVELPSMDSDVDLDLIDSELPWLKESRTFCKNTAVIKPIVQIKPEEQHLHLQRG